MIDWSEQLKIRIRESDESQLKHLVVKTLICFAIRLKYKKTIKWNQIYSEFPIISGKIADVYHENIKTKEIYCYEIQKSITFDWKYKTDQIYEEYEQLKTKAGFKSVNWILINLNKCPNKIEDIFEWITEQVC